MKTIKAWFTLGIVWAGMILMWFALAYLAGAR